MKLFRVLFFNSFFLIISRLNAFGQLANDKLTDSLIRQFEYYRIKKQASVLYAHFDKTIYTNNENVWFTAYLLKDAGKKKSGVLSVILVNDDDHKIALESKFIVAKGVSCGNLFLPDTIAAGNYSFILYTNNVLKGKPAAIFIQQVTIKNTAEISFTATLDLLDTGKFPADGKRKVLLVTNPKGLKIISGATVNYCLGNKLSPLAKGTVKTDKAGQYLFNLPVQNVDANNNVMEVQVTYGKETRNVKLLLPVNEDKPLVRFYPEGGNLSDGLRSIVGWEAKNGAGNPYKVTGVLYQNGEAIDTVGTDSYGMGKFSLMPQKGSKFYMKLLLTDSKDVIYNLPEAQNDLPVIKIIHAVADDTLRLLIQNKTTAHFNVLVHDYHQLFLSFPVEVNSLGRPVKIILNGVPKGIAEVTILDSLQRPCAERLFFAHYNYRNYLKISTDKSEYKKREQVHLSLHLLGADGKQARGLVSIACVQANRLEIRKSKDIESYFYLEHELGALPVKENYMGNSTADKEYLEDILLIKGWRRYTWKDLITSTPADTVHYPDSLTFKGTVAYYGKPLKKPVVLVNLRDSALSTFSTTSNGSFALKNENLCVSQDKKIHLFVSGDSPDGYNIAIDDPYQKINRELANNYTPLNYQRYLSTQIIDNQESLAGLEHVIHLKEVKIQGINDKQVYGAIGANDCGDYVCVFHILNCPNHRNDPGNTSPITGHAYTYHGMPGYIYRGCEVLPYESSKTLKGIYYAMEFYPADYLKYNPANPEYVSTLYWKHLFEIIPGKENAITFYTSDITGAFKIVVQGVTENDVVSGEKTFTVSKP